MISWNAWRVNGAGRAQLEVLTMQIEINRSADRKVLNDVVEVALATLDP